MKLKTVVVDRWETVVKNITEVQVRDENDEIIASQTVFSEDIESIDGGDKSIKTIPEFTKKYPNQLGMITEIEDSLLCHAIKQKVKN